MISRTQGDLAAPLPRCDRSSLQQDLDLIQIVHHRNKNQHRGATWYKHVKFLKSSLSRILALQVPADMPKSSARANRDSDNLWLQYYTERDAFLRKCTSIYVSFTRMIGTGQYVALGMILLGILARSWKILRGRLLSADHEVIDAQAEPSSNLDYADLDHGVVIERLSTSSHENSAKVGKAIDSQVSGSVAPSIGSPTPQGHMAEAVFRSEAMHAQPVLKRQKPSSPAQPTDLPSKKKKNRKKPRDLDEIDSIFG